MIDDIITEEVENKIKRIALEIADIFVKKCPEFEIRIGVLSQLFQTECILLLKMKEEETNYDDSVVELVEFISFMTNVILKSALKNYKKNGRTGRTRSNAPKPGSITH